MQYLIKMFHRDVYDYFPELVRGDPQVSSYFGRKYFPLNCRLQLFSSDGQAPHIDEENPYIRVITNFEGNLPMEVLERLEAAIRNMGYSIIRGKRFDIELHRRYVRIGTTDVKKDGRTVMNYGAVEKPEKISLVGANLVNWYEDQPVLKKATDALHMPLLVPDKPLLSREVVEELSELLYRAEHEQSTVDP